MSSSVSGFFSWVALNLPDFLMSHPVIDMLGIAVGVWVIAIVFNFIRFGITTRR